MTNFTAEFDKFMDAYCYANGIALDAANSHLQLPKIASAIDTARAEWYKKRMATNTQPMVGQQVTRLSDRLLSLFPSLTQWSNEINALKNHDYLEFTNTTHADTTVMLWRNDDDKRYELAQLKMNSPTVYFFLFDEIKMVDKMDDNFKFVMERLNGLVKENCILHAPVTP